MRFSLAFLVLAVTAAAAASPAYLGSGRVRAAIDAATGDVVSLQVRSVEMLAAPSAQYLLRRTGPAQRASRWVDSRRPARVEVSPGRIVAVTPSRGRA